MPSTVQRSRKAGPGPEPRPKVPMRGTVFLPYGWTQDDYDRYVARKQDRYLGPKPPVSEYEAFMRNLAEKQANKQAVEQAAKECFKKTELYIKVQNALGGAGAVASLGGVSGLVKHAKNLSKIVNTPPKPEEAYEKFAGRRTTRRKKGGNHLLKMLQSNGIDPRDIVDTYTKCLNEPSPEEEIEKFAGSRRARKTRRRHK